MPTYKVWEEKLQQILAGKEQTILILGGPDAGKTTFTNYLRQRLCESHRTVSVIDCDVGQSTLGPPTTLGLASYENSGAVSAQHHSIHLQFVGSTTPIGHFLPTLVGLKKLIDKANALRGEFVLVDTTGLIYGDAGQELKQAKIELLKPSRIFAFQRSDELEPILSPYRLSRTIIIDRMRISPAVRTRSADYRRSYREKKFMEYFSKASRLEIFVNRIGVWGTWLTRGNRFEARQLNVASKIFKTQVLYAESSFDSFHLVVAKSFPKNALGRIRDHFGVRHVSVFSHDWLEHRLISLNSHDECLAIGIVEKIDLQDLRMTVLTPFESPGKIEMAHFGSIRLDQSGKELRGD